LKLEEERLINAPTNEVWRAILDAQVLKDCVPGCTEMTGSLDDGMQAIVVQKVGPVKATFKGEVTFSDIVEGQSVTIAGAGQGGVAGFAKGGAQVTLVPQDDKTLLKYTVDAAVGGKLAQLGSRIIDSFANKMANQFFEKFQSIVEDGDKANGSDTDAKPSGGFFAWLMRLFGRTA
jgi:carbon monoxide dehydrogenase subunit G